MTKDFGETEFKHNHSQRLSLVDQAGLLLETVLEESPGWSFRSLTFFVLGLMQRTKKGLEELSVAIKECRESCQRKRTVGLGGIKQK